MMGNSSPAVRRCQLGIVFALPIEAHAFERLVADPVSYRGSRLSVGEGTLAGQRVAWAISGIGAAAAARTAQLLSDGHRPERLVSAGFAGGLDPVLHKGQLVFPAELLDAQGANQPPRAVDRELAESLWTAHPPGGLSLVTVADVVADAAAKQALRAATGAGLVDMESAAVAGVAATEGIGMLACRVISDTAAETLPRGVAGLGRPQSTMRRMGAALGLIGRRPRAAMELWRLWEQSLTNAQRLAQGLTDVARAVGSAGSCD